MPSNEPKPSDSTERPELIMQMFEILQWQLELAGDNDIKITAAFEEFRARAMNAGYEPDYIEGLIGMAQKKFQKNA